MTEQPDCLGFPHKTRLASVLLKVFQNVTVSAREVEFADCQKTKTKTKLQKI